jgi:Cation transporting ATPase, C-terminus
VVQGPATSLAYEPAEANVMDRPPRNIATDRLVSLPLLVYAYLIMGVTESLCCLGAYLWVFTVRGVDHSDIFLLNPKDSTWNSQADRNDQPAHGFSPDQQADIVRQVRPPRACSPIG